MSCFPELYFNVDNGYLEGLVRGFKAGVLRQGDYVNLVQCESLEGEWRRGSEVGGSSPSHPRYRGEGPAAALRRKWGWCEVGGPVGRRGVPWRWGKGLTAAFLRRCPIRTPWLSRRLVLPFPPSPSSADSVSRSARSCDCGS